MIQLSELNLRRNSFDGKKWAGPCPVHGGDNKQAFVVRTDEPVSDPSEIKLGRWWCFTHHCEQETGDKSGRIINGLVLLPAEKYTGKMPERSSTKIAWKASEPEAIPEEYEKVLTDVFELYKTNFRNSPGFRYLIGKRKVTAPEAGYALPGKFLLSKGFPKAILEELYLIYPGKTAEGKPYPKWLAGKDTMGGRVVLPYRWRGKLTCLYGRSIEKVEDSKKHLYTSTMGGRWLRGVFNEEALDKDRVILVEAAIDALTIKQAGLEFFKIVTEQTGTKLSARQLEALGKPKVVAIGGTNNDWVMERIKKEQRLILAFDNDPDLKVEKNGETIVEAGAGGKAAALWSRRFPQQVTRIIPPDGFKDFGEWWQAKWEKTKMLRTSRDGNGRP